MAVPEQSVGQLNRKLDSMKIDAYRKECETPEVPVNKDDVATRLEQQMQPSPPSESLNSSGSIASSETAGDAASSYGSRDDYPELAFVAAPHGFIPPHGNLYPGSPTPVMNMHGFIPYSMDGVHYHSQVMDYNYVNQPFCGNLSSGMQYPASVNNGYVYGPQVYPYTPQPYYQQAPGGQFFPASPGLPAGGVMMLDSQDPGRTGVVMSSGFTNMSAYSGPMPGFPMTMVPQAAPWEKGAIPVAVSYTPSHTLRASAPAWIEPSKPKGLQKEGNAATVPPVIPQPRGSSNSAQPNKSALLNPLAVNGIVPKSGLPPSGVKSSTGSLTLTEIPDSVVAQNAKVNGCLTDNNKQERKGNEFVSCQSPSLDTVYEQNKDAWVSKVRGEQVPPVMKTFKASCGGPNKDSGACLPNGEQYNSTDLVTKYDDAKHFIIKSYSEDNVHKSIQYGVWASTPNGNKKLDEAYQDAQRIAGGKPRGCPVFLFFSVNGSRQFCGVAEMTGPVDYTRTMEFWEQHKWSGSFLLKWHIIKDIPNSQLRRIILENNENKPVTNSRDTQEVHLQQGLEMLNIFKSYPARTSILDDFSIYPGPQKVVQDVKPQLWSPQCFPKIGEQIPKERGEADGLKTAKLNSTASKLCDNGPKPKEANCQEKPVAGKTSEISRQDSRMDKDKIKQEKENLLIPSKEERVMVPA